MSSEQSGLSRAQLLDLSDGGRLLNAIFSGQADVVRSQQSLDLCVQLHNSSDISLLSIVTPESLSPFDGPAFFEGQHFYCKVIPLLQADLTSMMTCVMALVRKGGTDLASNGPNGSFRDWCRADTSRAREVVIRASEGDALAQEFATFGLEVANDVETACDWLRGRDDILAVYAAVALGRMRYPNANLAARAIDGIFDAVGRRADDLLRGNALGAAVQILRTAGPTLLTSVRALVNVLCERPGPQTLFCMARELWSGADALDDQIVESLLACLSELDLTAAGTVNELDTALAHLLLSPHADRAIAAAARLLDRAEDAAEPLKLSAFSRQLLSGDIGLCQRTLVAWLLSAGRSRCEWITTLMRGDTRDPFEGLDLSSYALSSAELITLCRRVLGFLFLYPATAARVLVSCLRVADRKTAKVVSDLLFDPLLINYGGAAKSYVLDIRKGDASFSWVQRALKLERVFVKEARSVGAIKELRPSERHRQIERLRQQDEARLISKMTEDHSVFMKLVHRSVLLYGRRSVTYIGLPGETRKPIEMELSEHSFSFELPRLEALDPFGFDYTLRLLRASGRK